VKNIDYYQLHLTAQLIITKIESGQIGKLAQTRRDLAYIIATSQITKTSNNDKKKHRGKYSRQQM